MPSSPADHANKRALPARHHILTETVRAALERQANKRTEPTLDGKVILMIPQDNTIPPDYIYHSPPTQPTESTEPKIPEIMPTFRILEPPKRARRKPDTNEPPILPISDDYYLRRHLKHEREEKKQKNREKERLQHELLQQEQMVTRIRSLDRSTLLSIVSSLRYRVDTLDLEALHEAMLEDAEETLRRYDMLGLRHPRIQKPKKKDPISQNVIASTTLIPANIHSTSTAKNPSVVPPTSDAAVTIDTDNAINGSGGPTFGSTTDVGTGTGTGTGTGACVGASAGADTDIVTNPGNGAGTRSCTSGDNGTGTVNETGNVIETITISSIGTDTSANTDTDAYTGTGTGTGAGTDTGANIEKVNETKNDIVTISISVPSPGTRTRTRTGTDSVNDNIIDTDTGTGTGTTATTSATKNGSLTSTETAQKGKVTSVSKPKLIPMPLSFYGSSKNGNFHLSRSHTSNKNPSIRRSQRHVSAFGQKLPEMPQSEFGLPRNEYGEMMKERTTRGRKQIKLG